MALSETESVAADDGSIRIAESAASAPQQPFTYDTATGEEETLRSSIDFAAASPAAISPKDTPSGGTDRRDDAIAERIENQTIQEKTALRRMQLSALTGGSGVPPLRDSTMTGGSGVPPL